MSEETTILMDRDPLLGRTRLFHDLGTDRFAIESRYDLEPTLEATQLSRDQWPGHYRGTPALGMTLAARLPMPIWARLRKLGILQDPKALQRWLNEWPAFKATEGNAISLANRK